MAQQYELQSYNGVLDAETPRTASSFGGLPAPTSYSGIQAASHEMAEMQAAIYLAKAFPRDEIEAVRKLMNACMRPKLAEDAVYIYPRGGTSVTGPSIRLAEEIARCWGNMEFGWSELERIGNESTVRAFAWDKESNLRKVIDFTVKHVRDTSRGQRPLESERDIYELLANQAARRMRNCILALIPGDIVEDAVKQCEKTLVAHADITPEKLKAMVDAFEPYRVTKKHIEKRFQRNLDAITPAQYLKLREIYVNLKDGISEPGDWFDMNEDEEIKKATSATEALKGSLKAQKAPSSLLEDEPAMEEPEPASNAKKGKSATKQEPSGKLTIAQEYRLGIDQAESADELIGLRQSLATDKEVSASDKDLLGKHISERLKRFNG